MNVIHRRRLQPLLFVVVVLGGTLAAAACSPNRTPEAPDPEMAQADVLVVVNNKTYNDYDIFAVHDGQVTRFGQVTASSKVSLVMPRTYLGQGRQVRLRGEPIGGNRRVTLNSNVVNAKPFTSEQVVVQPGMSMEWTLEQDLSHSALVLH
jgi:hypothetical protein